ncbi:MAG TPA: type III PLP-dependent enzyme [Parachlamydiaceae bacterium]|nr:type III PLP-dependent enzyme [Nitrosopumilus sp.]HEV8052889.1 type III PLP-dependent enzyme [Parachlamydiaceae bacterium]
MLNLFNNKINIDLLQSLSKETPYFIFSKEKILEKYNEFKECFPKASIQYALKANSELEVLKILSDAGCGFEAASKYELDLLKKINSPAKNIIFGSSIKPEAHIKDFFNYGVDRFAFDTVEELEKIAVVAPGSRVYVRVVVSDSGSVFKMSEKFGTEIENVIPLLIHAKNLGLQPYGVSFNVGSQATNGNAWANAMEHLIPVIEQLKESGIVIEVLNLGGGYPCKYTSTENAPDLKEIAEKFFEQFNKLSFKPKLILEPGRGIIAETGVLVTAVVAKMERRGINWLFLDAGVYNALFEAMAYQGSTRYPIMSLKPAQDAGEKLFALAGPTGDGPDIITREALLPSDIDVGDRIIIHNIGAYSIVTSSEFNGFPKPHVYYV